MCIPSGTQYLMMAWRCDLYTTQGYWPFDDLAELCLIPANGNNTIYNLASSPG